MKKVLVVGANGTTGRLLTEQLSKMEGFEPLSMIRKEEQAEDLKRLGGEPVLADLEEDVTNAVKGADAVIFAAGSGSSTGPEKTTSVDQEGAKRVVDAAKDAGVKHFVMLSSMGADIPENGPDEMQHYLNAKSNADEHLIRSGLSYTIVRPGGLTDEKGTGKIQAAESIEDKSGSIPREDVAAALIACLSVEEVDGKVVEILSGQTPVEDALKHAFS
ncbi:NAD(P)H-binding protein [Bacillus lacus]|uniref:NAD(P)H-binding protein n=1 Tax=Metabacillus lacus TaxID=1983721 RepID=A0A7X2IYS7_9BACI|nr:SDR family oxidoreductase [Metabacillus lacus]MRX72288.1 NAD(P)H-binding protein [Metabacillus lacus]